MRLLTILLLCISINVNATHTVWIGSTGGGAIVVDNLMSTYGVASGDTIRIKTGVYTYLSFSNTNVTSPYLYILASDSGVTFTVCCGGESDITACNGLWIEGIKWLRGAFRGLNVHNACNNIYFKRDSMRAITDYGFFFDGLTYNGTTATMNVGIKFDHCDFDSMINGHLIISNNATQYFTIHDITADSTIASAGPADAIHLSTIADSVDIHDIRFTHTIMIDSSHNGVLYVQGNGRIYNIYSADREGDLCRCYAYYDKRLNVTGVVDTLFCYNWRDVGSRKYATIEWQHLPGDTSTNIKAAVLWCANFTSGNLRTKGYTPFTNAEGGGGSVVDVYTTYNNAVFINLLGYRLYIDSIPNPSSPNPLYTFNYIFHDGGGTRPSGVGRFGDTSHTMYRQTADSVGIRDTLTMNLDFTSIAKNQGTTPSPLVFNTDYRGTIRPFFNVWDIGAFEVNLFIALWIQSSFKVFKRVN